MKKLEIYQRSVLERRQKGYFQLRYEFVAIYGGECIYGSEFDLVNPRLRVPFSLLESTRSPKRVAHIIDDNKTKKGEWKKDNWTTAYLPILKTMESILKEER